MNFLKQMFFGLIAVGAAIAIWIVYVPSAVPYLERAGVYDLLGITPPGGDAGAGAGQQFAAGASRVVVADVGTGRINARVSSIGDGRAERSVTVRFEATGMIRNLPAVSGSYIEQGALMARLDDDAERIALERARLMVANAEGDLERLRRLSEAGAVSTVQLREAELAFRSAQLEVDQATLHLAQRQVFAPISGWVGLLGVEEGDRIGPQAALGVIADRSTLLIDFRVPERHIAELAIGMPLDVTPVAHPDNVLPGAIVAIDNVVDRASRTLRAQGRVENVDDTLRAGQAFQVALYFPGDSLPSVDPLAIQWSGDGSFVWIVRDGAAVRVPVTIRQRNSDSVLVEGALTEGESVIIEGVQTLRPGGAVEIVPGTAAAQDGGAAHDGTSRGI